ELAGHGVERRAVAVGICGHQLHLVPAESLGSGAAERLANLVVRSRGGEEIEGGGLGGSAARRQVGGAPGTDALEQLKREATGLERWGDEHLAGEHKGCLLVEVLDREG